MNRDVPPTFLPHPSIRPSAVLRSPKAITVSIEIMNAFVALRKIQFNQQGIFQRVEHIERKQLINDQKFEQLFSAMENKQIPTQDESK